MKSIVVLMLLSLALLSGSSISRTQTQEEAAGECVAIEQVDLVAWGYQTTYICCCETWNGQICCREQYYPCGPVIPGCFCK
jgi:hypothetical protein